MEDATYLDQVSETRPRSQSRRSLEVEGYEACMFAKKIGPGTSFQS